MTLDILVGGRAGWRGVALLWLLVMIVPVILVDVAVMVVVVVEIVVVVKVTVRGCSKYCFKRFFI